MSESTEDQRNANDWRAIATTQAATLERVRAVRDRIDPEPDGYAMLFLQELDAALGPAPAQAEPAAGIQGARYQERQRLIAAEARVRQLEAERIAIDLHSANLIIELARVRALVDGTIKLASESLPMDSPESRLAGDVRRALGG